MIRFTVTLEDVDALMVKCSMCGSYPTHCCVDRSGRPANPHQVRVFDVLGVFDALARLRLLTNCHCDLINDQHAAWCMFPYRDAVSTLAKSLALGVPEQAQPSLSGGRGTVPSTPPQRSR